MVERGKKRDIVVNASFKEQLKKEIKAELLVELRGKPIILDYSNNVEDKEDLIDKGEDRIGDGRKYVKTLIVLVLIVLVLDGVSLFFYYNPSFFKTNGFVVNDGSNLSGECSDGTPFESCSKEKPYYCSGGQLVKAGFTCGCPEGYRLDFQNCIAPDE